MKNEEAISITFDKSNTFKLSEYSSENENVFNGIDMSKLSISSLITSSEWQMRIYGYKKIINEVEYLGNFKELDLILINNVMNDKNVSSQNIGLQAISRFIDYYGQKLPSLQTIWKESILDILIKKTLHNSKTSKSSINLAFSFFEQSLIIEKGDLNKIEFIWEEMIDFVNNNRKAKGIVIKQLLGILKLFLSFIENYGLEYLPIAHWCKTVAPLLSECTDKLIKDCAYEILSFIFEESRLMNLIVDFLTPIQIKEIQRRSLELSKEKPKPIKIDFLDKLNQNNISINSLKNSDESLKLQNIDSFDSLESVDVVKLLPYNWLETVSNKEIKWSERKAIIDQFCNLCETHKKLAIFHSENKNAILSNKKNSPPTLTDYQNIFHVLQKIIKFETNTTLILSVIRLCSGIIKSLRGKLAGIIRPIISQIAIKLKDQNKIVCNESINFLNNVLRYVLPLDQIFDDLHSYGFKEKVSTAKCSAISICIKLIDDINDNKEALEKHLKGFKLLLNVIPSLFDDTSLNVRSSTFMLLVKLKKPFFGIEINSIIEKILACLNSAKLKLFQETERKLISEQKLDSNKDFSDKYSEFGIDVQNSNLVKSSQPITPNSETKSPKLKNSLKKKEMNKHSFTVLDDQKMNESNSNKLLHKKSNFTQLLEETSSSSQFSSEPLLPNSSLLENNLNSVNILETPKSENLPRILHSVSINYEQKNNFYEKSSNIQNFNKDLKQIQHTENKNNYYIVKFPSEEMVLRNEKIDIHSLSIYIKPFLSKELHTSMFSSDYNKINDSFYFWERYIYSFLEIEQKQFNFIYFLLLWIWNNLEMKHRVEYDRLIIAIIHFAMKRDIAFIQKFHKNLLYYLCFIIIKIIIDELFYFDKENFLWEYEKEKYEKLVILLTERKTIFSENISDFAQNSLIKKENISTSLLITTILISFLEKDDYLEKTIYLIINQLNLQNTNLKLIKNFGVSNIYYIFIFKQKNLTENVKNLLNNILSLICEILESRLWYEMVEIFQGLSDNKNEISIINDNKENKIYSRFLIITSLEYEAIQIFNIIGSTGNPKEMGFFVDTILNSNLLTKLSLILKILTKSMDVILKDTENINFLSKNFDQIYLLLVRHFYYVSELSLHIFFLMKDVKTRSYFKSNLGEYMCLGNLFLKFVEHLDKITNVYQYIISNDEFPIKLVMINTLFIMSNYFNWKEHIKDENQKANLVNSLNNIMGVNIISSFQKDLPKLVNTIIEVIIFGINSEEKSIFDSDLLNRLLPKVLRRIKAFVSNHQVPDSYTSIISHFFKKVANENSKTYSEKLIPLIEFILDYLIILQENNLDIHNCENFDLDMLNKFKGLSTSFQEKLDKINLIKEKI